VPLFDFDSNFRAILLLLRLDLLLTESKELLEHEPEHTSEAEAINAVKQVGQRLFLRAGTTKDDTILLTRGAAEELEEDCDKDDGADSREGRIVL